MKKGTKKSQTVDKTEQTSPFSEKEQQILAHLVSVFDTNYCIKPSELIIQRLHRAATLNKDEFAQKLRENLSKDNGFTDYDKAYLGLAFETIYVGGEVNYVQHISKSTVETPSFTDV